MQFQKNYRNLQVLVTRTLYLKYRLLVHRHQYRHDNDRQKICAHNN